MPSYIVDLLLPRREIHLLAGPTGAGKTRWLLDMLSAWEVGENVLGYKSFPCPWVYVVGDRTASGTLRTMDSMGINADSIPVLPAWDLRLSLEDTLHAAKERGAQFLVIEGFGRYAPERGNSTAIAHFLQDCYTWIHKLDLTILGVMESPKMKPRDRYGNPRQRISGAATWGHSTETIFLVEPADEQHPENPMRWLFVCPRNAPGQRLSASLSSGRFIFQP